VILVSTSQSANRDARIRVVVAASGGSAARLAHVLSGDYVEVVAIIELDDDVIRVVDEIAPDVVVLAGGAERAMAHKVAEAVAARSSRVTVMIVDDPDGETDTRVFWPKDRLHRIAPATEPPAVPSLMMASPV
jgi:chemotaxis response regulator CheB